MRPAFGAAFLALTVLFFGLLFLSCSCCNCKSASTATACLSNLKQQAVGSVVYAYDHDERLPLRDSWMDGIARYVGSAAAFHEPEGPKGGYGYAFNAALSGAKSPPHPEKVPMVYDSVNPIRNASDLVTSLPSLGRHHGRDNIGYADGHAKRSVVSGGS